MAKRAKGYEIMGKGIAIVAIIVVIIVAVLGIWGYQQYQQRDALRDVQISVEDVEVVSVNLSTARLNFSLRVTNPNTNPATLDRTDYTVFVNNISLGTGQNLEQVTIPAGGSVVIPQPFNVSYSGAVQSAWSYLQEGGAEYRLVGTAYFDSPLGAVGVPYNVTVPSS